MVPVKKHEASEFSKAAAFRNNFFLTFAAVVRSEVRTGGRRATDILKRR